jgi:hypothetical protein
VDGHYQAQVATTGRNHQVDIILLHTVQSVHLTHLIITMLMFTQQKILICPDIPLLLYLSRYGNILKADMIISMSIITMVRGIKSGQRVEATKVG